MEKEPTLAELKARITILEKWRQFFENRYTDLASSAPRDKARLAALETMVFDLAVHAGVSGKRVESCFLERELFILDRMSRSAEDFDAGAAATLDTRDLNEVSTDETFPALFTNLGE